MAIDELDDHNHGTPRKWLDKKKYFRIDPETGKPQLIRVEPLIDNGGFVPESVKVFIDEKLMVMDRDAAEMYVATMGVTPIEEFPQWWKHGQEN